MVLPVSVFSAGCATTQPVFPSVEVRPVLMDNNGDFDLKAADKQAAHFYNEGAFISAYNEYQNTVLHMPSITGAHKDYKALLGFADAAMALSGLGEKYQDEARLVYDIISKAALNDTAPENTAPENTASENTGLTKAIKSRAEAGLVLLDSMSAAAADVAGQRDIEARIMLAIDVTPSDPRLWNALGQVYDRKQNWFSALDSYVTALRLSHDNGATVAPVQNNMGMSLMMQGRTLDALQKFKQAHTAHPDVQLYDNNYRLALILSDNLGQAVEGLEGVRVAQLYNDAGFIAHGNGDEIRARKLYEKAILTSPVYFAIAEQNLKKLS